LAANLVILLPAVNGAESPSSNLRSQDNKAATAATAAAGFPPSNTNTITTTPVCRARAFNDLGDAASYMSASEVFALQPPVFPSTFAWGVTTSAYQIEGAVNEDGRGASIWDVFAHTPGKIAGNATGDVACDHYHRYEEDVKLMQSLGVTHYRLSLSWSRLLPTGTEEQINPAGIVFYNTLIDALLAAKIEPAVTLYHWDLPQALQQQGGWQNSSLVVQAFSQYADLCFDSFGDRVKMWFTINEPWSTAVLGHGLGVMAPGIKDQQRAVYVVGHTQLLAHAAAVKVYREKYQEEQGGKIGIVLSTQVSLDGWMSD
jgi:beta-glucosidase/6-phospho-beta-glucosidase/beta-galactosidase